MLDDRSKREIIGVALSVIGVALMIAVLTKRTGVASDALANGLRLAVGVGAYVLPLVLVLWGVSFFVRIGDISEGRTGIGLGLVVVGLVSMLSLATPGRDFFGPALRSYGGYVGASVAWVSMKFVGPTIGYVVLVGVVLAGLVMVGLSISGALEGLRGRWASVTSSSSSARPETAYTRADEAGPRTVPLDEETQPTTGESGPRRHAHEATDPEAVRKTLPAPVMTGPRRMEGFALPDPALLVRTTESASTHRASENELKTTARVISDTLATFNIEARVVDWIAGPTVTLFELEIARGVRVSAVANLADDLALALAASQIRVLAPIPGKSLVGVEVPNVRRRPVTLADVLTPAGEGGPLLLGIGKDVSGESIVVDLATMPHLLIGGSTGSGKSVAISSMLVTMLMRATPSEVRLILIDPKRVELTSFNGVPHLYVPVVTEPKEAASALAWAVSEMERRLKVLSAAGVRNVSMYNEMVQAGELGEDATELPYLVIVIDELADLMMVAAKEVEDSICRIAQLARAAGIHLIVATQRPEANVVTGLIKANITNRIAFMVASSIDSRVILDGPGAEKLVGEGDMLFAYPRGWPKPKRIQGCFVSEAEIEAVVDFLKSEAQPDYHEEILHLKVSPAGGGVDEGEDDDPLLWEAADVVVTSQLGSTSMLQRRLKVGYARAGRIMDILEAKGVVGPPSGSKPREVLVDVEELESIKAFDRVEQAEAR